MTTICAVAPQAFAAPVATTTTLAITSGGNALTSGGSVASGSEVTLTASVSFGSMNLTVGQVNFCDTATNYCTDIHLLGTAQLTSAGTAVLRIHPGIGSHSYKAVFAGTPNGVLSTAASASNAVAVTVTGTFPTTTAIAASGSAGNYTLTATVTGSVNATGLPAPAGSVSFLDTSNSNAVLASPSLGNAVFASALVNVSKPQIGNEPTAILAGDFNGDGNLDLAVEINETTQSVSILLGDGTGNFTEVTKSPITAKGRPILVQDFNGDGIPDLLLSSDLNNTITILLGNGDGTFTVAPGSPFTTNSGVYPIVVADFNGDGIPDIAAAGGYYLVIMSGNGDGSFKQMRISYSASSSFFEAALWDSMVTGDFNGDGIADFAVLETTSSQSVAIFLGNGEGTFSQVSSNTVSSEGAGSPTSLAMGDFNGDGKLDLAVPVYGSSGSLAILLGNGDGTFYQASGNPVAVEDWPNRVKVGDFNGDGIPDVFVAAQTNGQTLNILLGNGDGTFSQMPTGSAQLPCGSSTVLGDFNGDGVTDIVSSSFYDSTAELLLTQLTQTTTATATGIAPVGTGIHLVDASYAENSTYSSSISATTGLTATGYAITGTSVSVAAGASTGNTSTITVTPSGNFTGPVTLTAAITSSPAGAVNPPTFSFGATSPVSITDASAGTASMTITTVAAAGCGQARLSAPVFPWYRTGGAVLACVFFFCLPARRRRWRAMLGMVLFLVILSSGVAACGGSSSGGGSCLVTRAATTSGTYTVTLTGTSGTIKETSTVTLTVQ